jgi:N-acetylmuramic acid 6-phosphate etherase
MSENVHPRADELDGLSAHELLAVMHAEDVRAVQAIAPHLDRMAEVVERVTARLQAGGALHYFGAGTSGMIARLDAAECPATFGAAGDVVHAHYVEGAAQEDDSELGEEHATSVTIADVAVAISASGRTRYTLGALAHASKANALTVAITCNPGSPLARSADLAVEVASGPEVIAGSTRLKAGTVQKLLLNMLSTAVFTRLGHTHRGRMVAVVAANDKLRERAAHIVADLAGITLEDARQRIKETQGDIRAALAAVRLQ